jgi:predicted nucleic acid-binding Zn ribbon protein
MERDMIAKENYCELCGKALFGRADKRFCNDNCRNTFNRAKALEKQNKAHENLPEIFLIIKQNYKILRSFGPPLGPDEYSYNDKTTLAEEGVNTKFFTSIFRDGDKLWKFCFERGWYEYESGIWEICDRREQAETC